MTGDQYLADIIAQFAGYRKRAEKALAQVSDEAFFKEFDPGGNSLAILVKHIGGNLRSRWRDVLTSDGEKSDRHRDSEFEITPNDSRESLMARWNEGWDILEASLKSLPADDLTRTITIRSEPHTLYKALHRSLTHTAEHIGQIIMLAKHLAGEDWQTLSIARGQSEAFNRKMTGGKS